MYTKHIMSIKNNKNNPEHDKPMLTFMYASLYKCFPLHCMKRPNQRCLLSKYLHETSHNDKNLLRRTCFVYKPCNHIHSIIMNGRLMIISQRSWVADSFYLSVKYVIYYYYFFYFADNFCLFEIVQKKEVACFSYIF